MGRHNGWPSEKTWQVTYRSEHSLKYKQMNHSINIRGEISYLFLSYQTRDIRPGLAYIGSSQSSEKNANDNSVLPIQWSTEDWLSGKFCTMSRS